ncbi:hypothetical protein V8F06_013221 [Rhypophila decipiens]
MDTQSSTRAVGLESLPTELFEHLTDYLRIQDVKNFYLTSKIVSTYTRTDWSGFFRRRLVRHADRNTRVLSFLVLLNSLYEHYLDKGKATWNDISSAINRLRKGLAVDSGWGLSDRIQSLKRAETLQVMCYYMETIDHLTDDFASQLVAPISPRQMVLLVANHYEPCIWPGDCPRWPTPESPIVLSTAERARFREGFLAHQVLCLLSKKNFHPCPSPSFPQRWHPFTGRLSPLEIERIHSIHDYLFKKWLWILTDGFERTNWCKTRDSLLKPFHQESFFWHQTHSELADEFVSRGIAVLGRELDPTRPSWTEFDYDDGEPS